MNVWQEDDGTSVLTDREYLGLSDYIDVVTEQMAELEAAGLAVANDGLWELTPAGREALRELEGRR